jgi:hypothetical protein
VGWEHNDFTRLSCLANDRDKALSAIEARIARLRGAGWEIPPASLVEVRPSGFGYAASLLMPERVGARHVLRRWNEPRARSVSGTMPRAGVLRNVRDASDDKSA